MSSSSSSTASEDNVIVAVRMRPMNSREKMAGAERVVFMAGDQVTLKNPNFNPELTDEEQSEKEEYTFDFDYVYDSFDPSSPVFASQESLFQDLGTRLLDKTFAGYNSSVFAYGQTGSGKSYSMTGPSDNPGIISRVSSVLFERISANTDANVHYEVQVSYLEVYNERIQDLFVPSEKRPRKGLKVRRHPKKGAFVQGLRTVTVDSYAQLHDAMQRGNAERSVAATKMNATSSRSHSVFTITLVQRKSSGGDSGSGTKGGPSTKRIRTVTSSVSLVDLAGSERQSNTGAKGQRLKEACAINQSLSALGNVISALARVSEIRQGKGKNSSRKPYVPYRDSVLTQLLESSLGGNSFTVMIAAVSPADSNFEETLSTLRYADRAAAIVNQLEKQEEVVEDVVEAESEVDRLKRELAEQTQRVQELEAMRRRTGGRKKKRRRRKSNDEEGEEEEDDASDDESDNDTPQQPDAEELRLKRELAELQAKLDAQASQMKNMQQTYEDRLKIAEEYRNEQDEALVDLGLSLQDVSLLSGVDVSQTPHLLNLSEDPALDGELLYFFREGENVLGRSKASNIRLVGRRIAKEHCTVTWSGNSATLKALPTGAKGKLAPTYVNGTQVGDADVALAHGDRVIVGAGAVFRVVLPWATAESDSTVAADWRMAVDELAQVQGKVAEQDKAEQEKLQEQIDALEAEVEEQEEVAEQKKALEEELKATEKELQEAIKAAEAEEKESDKLAARIHAIKQEQQTRAAEAQRKYRELKEEAAKEKQESIRALKQQAKALAASEKQKQILSMVLEKVDEANDMAEEMDIDMVYTLEYDGDDMQSLQLEEAQVKAVSTGGGGLEEVWDWSVFDQRLDEMRQRYQQFLDDGIPANGFDEDNPFLVFPPDEKLACGAVSLKALELDGPLQCVQVPLQGDGVGGGAVLNVAFELQQTIGNEGQAVLRITVLDAALGREATKTSGLFVMYDFPPSSDADSAELQMASTQVVSERQPRPSLAPVFEFESEFCLALDDDLVDMLRALDLQVFVVGHDDPLANDPEFLASQLAKSQAANQAQEKKLTELQSDLQAQLAALREQTVHLEQENEKVERELDAARKAQADAEARAAKAESKACILL